MENFEIRFSIFFKVYLAMQTNYKLLLNIITVLSVVFNSNAFSQNVLFTYGDNTVYSDQVENACTSQDIAFTDDFLEIFCISFIKLF